MTTDDPVPLAALKEAIDRAGGQAGLAREINKHLPEGKRKVRQPHVHYWLHESGQVPDTKVLACEAATGVPKERLRPDLYPATEAQPV